MVNVNARLGLRHFTTRLVIHVSVTEVSTNIRINVEHVMIRFLFVTLATRQEQVQVYNFRTTLS